MERRDLLRRLARLTQAVALEFCRTGQPTCIEAQRRPLCSTCEARELLTDLTAYALDTEDA